MKQESISIKEIAELAGTSVATVSRVIHQNGRFSKETEERVRRVIEEYGYQPNVLAQGLRQDKTHLIGVIVPDITHIFFARLFRAIELQLYQRGYLAILCDTNESDGLESLYVEQLKNMRFSGLIYMNGNPQKAFIPGLATVYLDRYPLNGNPNNMYFIGSDNYQAGYLAAEALMKAGRTHPAIVTIEHQEVTQQRRNEGFCACLREHGLSPIHTDSLNVDRSSYEAGCLVTASLLDSHPECDSIYYTSDVLAHGGMQYLREHSIRIPQDIALVGMDDIPASASYNLTTIRQQTQELGMLAADTIIRLIEGEEVPRQQILSVELVERGTV